MSLVQEFKNFVMRGNVLDLAVAVVIGAAFNAVVTAFVSDIITPLIGVAGHFNFATLTYTFNNSTFLVGLFINALISFLTIAVVIFFFIIKPVSTMNERAAKKAQPPTPTTKQCPECLQMIPIGAKRCMYCTSRQKK